MHRLLIVFFIFSAQSSIGQISNRIKIQGLNFKLKYYLTSKEISTSIEFTPIDSNYSIDSFTLYYACKTCDIYEKRIVGNRLDSSNSPICRSKDGEYFIIDEIYGSNKSLVKKFQPLIIDITTKSDIEVYDFLEKFYSNYFQLSLRYPKEVTQKFASSFYTKSFKNRIETKKLEFPLIDEHNSFYFDLNSLHYWNQKEENLTKYYLSYID
ncbi:MAG: hypothetical protein ACK58Q_07490, partial [Chitinophagales bacterium]